MNTAIVLFSASFCLTAIIGFCLLQILDRSRRVRRVRLVRFDTGHPDKVADTISRRLQASKTAEQGRKQGHRWGGFGTFLETRIRESGLVLTPEQAVLIMVALGMLSFIGLTLWTPLPGTLGFFVAFGLGYLIFNVYLGYLRSRRLSTFTEALPDCIDMFARGLRSGQPVPSALQVVANQSSGIAKEEFQHCCEEMKLGVSLVDALMGVSRRVGSAETGFIAVATSLQAETGGNLVETLENLSALLRERRKLRKKAAALTAEVRVSALILSSLPFVVGATLWFMNPGYLMPLMIDQRGQIMALAGVFSLGLGIFSMSRLSRIDV